ncbi:hypothetical protein IWX50DRAFT_637701 [Phyllosticta citricarpa]
MNMRTLPSPRHSSLTATSLHRCSVVGLVSVNHAVYSTTARRILHRLLTQKHHVPMHRTSIPTYTYLLPTCSTYVHSRAANGDIGVSPDGTRRPAAAGGPEPFALSCSPLGPRPSSLSNFFFFFSSFSFFFFVFFVFLFFFPLGFIFFSCMSAVRPSIRPSPYGQDFWRKIICGRRKIYVQG